MDILAQMVIITNATGVCTFNIDKPSSFTSSKINYIDNSIEYTLRSNGILIDVTSLTASDIRFIIGNSESISSPYIYNVFTANLVLVVLVIK